MRAMKENDEHGGSAARSPQLSRLVKTDRPHFALLIKLSHTSYLRFEPFPPPFRHPFSTTHGHT
jgi:hypothetical protein